MTEPRRIKLRWQRDADGWLVAQDIPGQPIYLCNMRGQSVLWTGKTTPCWLLCFGTRGEGNRYFTKADAIRALAEILRFSRNIELDLGVNPEPDDHVTHERSDMEKLDITIVDARKSERNVEQPDGWKGSSHMPTKGTILVVQYEARELTPRSDGGWPIWKGSVDVAWPMHVPPTDKLIEGAIRADIMRQRNASSDIDFVQSLKGKKLGGAA